LNIDAPYGRPKLWANIARHIALCPQHRFITLTKAPENIPDIDIPDNWWIGTSVTGAGQWSACETTRISFTRVRMDRHGILSHEPWLGPLSSDWYENAGWVIIGGLTGKGAQGVPPHEIEAAHTTCQKLGIPLFVKRNAGIVGAPQEYPKGLMLPGGGDGTHTDS